MKFEKFELLVRIDVTSLCRLHISSFEYEVEVLCCAHNEKHSKVAAAADIGSPRSVISECPDKGTQSAAVVKVPSKKWAS